MRNLLGGKGANLAEMAIDRPARPARLHHHHRGLHRITTTTTSNYPAELQGPGRATPWRRSRRPSGRSSATQHNPLLVSVPLRRARLDARHDGHGPQPRPQRRHRRGPCAKTGNDAASPGTAIAASSRCTARRRARRRAPPLRGDHRARQSTTPASSRTPTLTADDWQERGRAATRRWSQQETGKPFPQDPQEQLWGAIGAVFGSWMNDARHRLSPAARHPRRLGHRRQRPGDGLRQHGRRLRHRRRLHPRSRPPARTSSTAST